MKDCWSCSKFANLIRGDTKPTSGTITEWREWEAAQKAKHPIRYWLAEEGLSVLQEIVCYPFRMVYDIKCELENRFVAKTHTLTSKLKRGEWWDLDTRILNCLFDELVNFVEIDLAWMQHRLEPDKYGKRKHRNPKAGVDYLTWEITSETTKGTQQSKSAQQIHELYIWWTSVRPNRVDPYDSVGFNAYCKDENIMSMKNNDTIREMLIESLKLEEQYEKEDTLMLIKLIKVRRALWV